jgi:arylsulfatase A-like enzyme
MALSLLAALPTISEAQAADEKPNIVYIVSDDLGWKDVGYHGSDIKTPNLDSLAKNGATLEQFYAQPMCTQTRAAIMTGRYPMRYGLQTAVIPQGHSYGLATDEWLLPQALKDVGYDTAIIGKWHLGHVRGAIRQGDWKLIWYTLLPQRVELYDIAKDTSEADNVAEEHPDKVAELQKRINALSAQAEKPVLLQVEFANILERMRLPPTLPPDLESLNAER